MSENQSEFPFHECAEDATHAAINKSGKGFKSVAYEIWPALKMETSYCRLRNCLTADRPEKLTADEHVFIANFTGHYDYLYYISVGCHHSRPIPIKPADEKAALMREFIQSAKLMERQLAQIEGLSP